MPKHYVYRMDHDTGFAPHTSNGMCTLCGCKTKTVESWAQPGSWVIAIGGKGTGKPGTLIYALEVEATPSLAELRRRSPALVAYLQGRSPSSRVLVSRHFYYLGNNAISLPASLERLVIRTQGCKTVADDDLARLIAHLERRFAPGVHGAPNNLPREVRGKCRCGRANKRLKQTGGEKA